MALTSSRSELSNLQTNKTKRLYRLPTRFYGYQLFVLIALAVVFTWLSRNEALDRWITGFWYDAATQTFPLQKDHLLDLLNHRGEVHRHRQVPWRCFTAPTSATQGW